MWTPLFSLLLLSCDTPTEWTRAYEIEDLSQVVGGPKGLARPGDFVIENDKVRFAVLGNRPSMGNHTDGGSNCSRRQLLGPAQKAGTDREGARAVVHAGALAPRLKHSVLLGDVTLELGGPLCHVLDLDHRNRDIEEHL